MTITIDGLTISIINHATTNLYQLASYPSISLNHPGRCFAPTEVCRTCKLRSTSCCSTTLTRITDNLPTTHPELFL